ncbi:hypothetical protein, conserved [Eimeria tenella]|uniref:START domain-containing protein n=1 Tax=Eimeria tenella TaxID=5802 RepID=U6KYD3_EIMTE|nr:hypothetical protein, conserved [Eimeria tenella]CDJ42956.1 hypothetical protein, conserved [Eimeria tenella]|eukprot:XP_013233706.1 hypothetical protein, conserved [Eimeria tenella]
MKMAAESLIETSAVSLCPSGACDSPAPLEWLSADEVPQAPGVPGAPGDSGDTKAPQGPSKTNRCNGSTGGKVRGRVHQPSFEQSRPPSVSPDLGEVPQVDVAATAAAAETAEAATEPSVAAELATSGASYSAAVLDSAAAALNPAAAAAETAANTRRTAAPSSSAKPSAGVFVPAAKAPFSSSVVPSPEAAGKPSPLPAAAGASAASSRGECSNPRAHECLSHRMSAMKTQFGCFVPGFLAAEDREQQAPCCSLSSPLHTIVHVCECMSSYEVDRALAIENLRLERVRDAHAVVLTLAKKYGPEKILEDADLVLILYKYDEMDRMYSVMSGNVLYKRRCNYFRKVTSSLLPDLHSSHRKKDNAVQDGHLSIHDPHHDLGACTPQRELDRCLREGMRRQFSLRSLGTLTNCQVPVEHESWSLAIEEQNRLKIYYRRHSSSTLLSFRVEGTVDACLLNIISVLNEMDLYKDWIPYYTFPLKLGLRDVKRLYQFGRVEQIDLLQLDFPWPMNNRDCCVEIWAADDLEHTNRFFVRVTSLDGDTTNPRVPLAIPVPPPKTLRLYCEGAVVLVPLSPTKTFIELFWTLDPKVHLNDYIVNFFAKVFAKSSFHAFCKVCIEATVGEHARRRAQFPLLYGFVEGRLCEFESAVGGTEENSSSGNNNSTHLHNASNSRNALGEEGSAPSHNAAAQSAVLSAKSSKVDEDEALEGLQNRKSKSSKGGFLFRRRRNSFATEVA